ncbi:unnamed protein product [Trichobilharzia regenti]|nr:unnamed protein product [Trichobilharzia regenti]
MDNKGLEEISKNPLLAPNKRKKANKTRTVKDLFNDVGPEASFKDKRGRPWFKNPRAYVKQKLAPKTERIDDDHSQSSDDGGSNSDSSRSRDSESKTSSDSDDGNEVDFFEDIEDLQGNLTFLLTIA